MKQRSGKFGALVRREREAKEIGLREMAKKIGVSPTYLSKIERGDFDPPAEDKVRRIAEIIGHIFAGMERRSAVKLDGIGQREP